MQIIDLIVRLNINLILGLSCLFVANKIYTWNKIDLEPVLLHADQKSFTTNNNLTPKMLYYAVIWFDKGQIDFDHNLFTTKSFINEIGKLFALYPASILEISGHADQSGPISENENLSYARANSVAKFLQERLYIHSNRIQLIASGTNKLLDTGLNCAAHARNRRVEIKMLVKLNDHEPN